MQKEIKFSDFKYYMVDMCGMEETEDGMIQCCECQDYVLEEDFKNQNWRFCPICGYDIVEEVSPFEEEDEDWDPIDWEVESDV